MARVAYLKQGTLFGSGSTFIGVYDNKEGFDGESALCVQLKDGVTGYIPLTESSVRGSYVRTVGTDNKPYRLAYQKKKAYEDVAYCKMNIRNYTASNTVIESNYVQITTSSANTDVSCYIDMKFYNSQNEDITNALNYVEDDVNMTILVNAYLVFSGSGGSYMFAYNQENIIQGSIGGYTNRDLTINTKFNNSARYEVRSFGISVKSSSIYNAAANRITFRGLTINGRDIPIRLS